MFRVGLTKASLIVPSICKILWIALSREVFSDFLQENWFNTANNFQIRAHFPHSLGAIDGKHVRIIIPEHSGSLFYNYKNYFSLVLIAVADNNYKYMHVDVGGMGNAADPTVFQDSTLGNALHDGSLNIPKPEKVTEDSGYLPFVSVTDEAFGISVNLMRPYPENNMNKSQKIFNYRLSSARKFVECTFGIFTNKWKIFHLPVIYLSDRDGVRFEDTLQISLLRDCDGRIQQHF
ncbi:hypothetical protein PR048_033754 [Dryococelus australis]|uniref:DDE Tnp4 domain-containing protein n=1 Tax=Dryococelus australis TaxID=614101 RepID=A0ABQ9G2D8_9NEOP|nr:hypothetical protein PR048_033754 [Dryococelus australis]